MEESSSKNSLIIRNASEKDIQQLKKIEERCFNQRYRYGIAILKSLIDKQPKYISLVAQMSNPKKIVGFCIGEIDDMDLQKGRIISIQVDPPYQRTQIGTFLLRQLEIELIAEFKIKRVELQVQVDNQAAIDFYLANKYEISKQLKNYYDRGDHAFLLMKSLGP